jgi:CheY-like chemotaxis protein
MVKQLAELHGGTVAVASAEGEGACFAAWLPLRSANAPGMEPAADAPPAALPQRDGVARVALVVESDDHAADLVRLLLEAEGFSVIRATNAGAALLLAAQQAPSLITLDIQLPGIDGWEFLAQLRKSSTLACIPVVVVAGAADGHMALSGGAAAVLQKPVSRAQLRLSLASIGLDHAAERTWTILVVDDDPKAVEVIAAFLPAPAYAVVRAYSGSEAISLARLLRPDLILLDLLMPQMSGFEVVEALRRDASTAHIPVLVVTASQVSAEDRATLAGDSTSAVTVVQKAGFNRAGFVAEVRRALPQA